MEEEQHQENQEDPRQEFEDLEEEEPDEFDLKVCQVVFDECLIDSDVELESTSRLYFK